VGEGWRSEQMEGHAVGWAGDRRGDTAGNGQLRRVGGDGGLGSFRVERGAA